MGNLRDALGIGSSRYLKSETSKDGDRSTPACMGAHFVPLREQRLRRREQEEMAPLDKCKRPELNREEESCKQEVLEVDRKRPEDERRERHEAAERRQKVLEHL